jgi:hypothetical protein
VRGVRGACIAGWLDDLALKMRWVLDLVYMKSAVSIYYQTFDVNKFEVSWKMCSMIKTFRPLPSRGSWNVICITYSVLRTAAPADKQLGNYIKN